MRPRSYIGSRGLRTFSSCKEKATVSIVAFFLRSDANPEEKLLVQRVDDRNDRLHFHGLPVQFCRLVMPLPDSIHC